MIAGQIKRREDNKNFDIIVEDDYNKYTIKNVNKFDIDVMKNKLRLVLWLDNYNKTIFQTLDYLDVV